MEEEQEGTKHLVLLYLAVIHFLALLGPFYFTWNAFYLAAGLYFVTGIGVTLSYHRNLAHRSFKLPKWLEYTFAYCAALSLQGSPVEWVSTHRLHHQYTDTVNDPHSPLRGFWYSHIGWIADSRSLFGTPVRPLEEFKNVADLKKQRFYVFLHYTYPCHFFGLGILLYALGGLPFLVWGLGVRTVCVFHITFSINSICHIWGKQAWNTGDLSKNNWLLGVLANGEGWHNNHHAFDYSARQGLQWWEIDNTWYVISFLKAIGLATDVKLPTEAHKKRMAFPTEVDHPKTNKLFLLAIHSLAFLGPSYFNWSAFCVAFGLYIVTGVGITLSFHRNLAHRSFRLPRWLEYSFAYCAVLALQGSPIEWVSTHRFHHEYSDTWDDPHSPIKGFWYSHIGWVVDPARFGNSDIAEYKNVGDLKKQQFYMFIHDTYVFHSVALGILLYAAGGMPFLVWGTGVRTVFSLHVTFSMQSICQTWGKQVWNTGDFSKNNWVLGLLALGEGWHNNHHAFEYAARQGIEWWEIDFTWYIILFLEAIGLATDVKRPTESHKRRRALPVEAQRRPIAFFPNE